MAQDKAEIEYQFHQAMLGIYEEALNDVGYRATRFRQMVNRHGGLEAARRLLRGSDASDGLLRLWEAGRLDITVEALVLREPWRCLFENVELQAAEMRLKEFGYSESA